MPLRLLFVAALSFLLVLAALAYVADRGRWSLARWLEHPLAYTLALSVYFSGWAYFGTGTAFLQSGVSYLSHEMGWSLTFLFGWPLLLRAIRFLKAHHVTTLPGALSVRYGASGLLAALVSGVLVMALLPYIALQLQAIAFAIRTLAPAHPALGGMVLAWTLIVALFAILFGARHADPTLRHPGIVAAMAVSGALKLAAVGILAGVAFGRFPELFAGVPPETWPPMTLEGSVGHGYLDWGVNLVISMAGVLLLPHVFHLAVVENVHERQVQGAKWGFPLYGWIFEVCLIPIAVAGVLLGLEGAGQQAAILLVPATPGLQLLAFLGGVASATGMAIVTLIALANLLVIDVLLPSWPGGPARIGAWLLPLRWGVMLAIALASYALWRHIDHDFLFRLGLGSFVAVSQLAPAFFLGLTWPRLQLPAVLWGLALALLAWLYTGFLPSLAGHWPAIAALLANGPWHLSWLRPEALFGIEGLSGPVHSFLWSTLLNLGALLFVTLRQPASPEQEHRTRELVAGTPQALAVRAPAKALSSAELAGILAPYLGAERAASEVGALWREVEADTPLGLLRIRDGLERLLTGPLGPVAARRVLEGYWPVADGALVDVMEAYRKLEQMLELSQEELANRLRELSVLNAASERLVAIEDPQGQLEAVADLVASSFGLDLVAIMLLEERGLRRCVAYGVTGDAELVEVPAGSTLEDLLRRPRLAVVTRGAEADAADPLVAAGAHAVAYVPIALGEHVLGLVACGVARAGFYLSEDFLSLLQAIANNLAIALTAAQHRRKEALLKAQYETTLANLSDAVRVSDRAGRTLFVNDAYVRLIRAPGRERILASSFAELYRELGVRDAAGRELPQAMSPSARALATQEVQHLAAARMRTLDGQELVLNISSVPVLDAGHEVVQVVTVYRDITELYGLKESLERRVAERTEELATERDRLQVALADLQNLEKVKAAFINAVSHDLRIPLTGIVGYAEFIEDEIGGPVSAEQREFARSIIEASKRMTGLLNELLDFARMEAGHLSVQARCAAFAGILHEAVATFRPAFEKKALHLEQDVPASLPEVYADPDRVIQVLSNLLSNAIKFVPEGGTVTVRVRAAGSRLRVEVADTGVGIPPEDLPHMFERFYQTKAGRQAGGTGLGLSISKALIEAQGGQMGVQSRVGEGATFWFTLPFGPEEP